MDICMDICMEYDSQMPACVCGIDLGNCTAQALRLFTLSVVSAGGI